jgi:hypothetical protein
MCARMYDHVRGDWGAFVQQGVVECADATLATPD